VWLFVGLITHCTILFRCGTQLLKAFNWKRKFCFVQNHNSIVMLKYYDETMWILLRQSVLRDTGGIYIDCQLRNIVRLILSCLRPICTQFRVYPYCWHRFSSYLRHDTATDKLLSDRLIPEADIDTNDCQTYFSEFWSKINAYCDIILYDISLMNVMTEWQTIGLPTQKFRP